MGLLFSHNLASVYFQNENIQLSDGEASALAEAGKNVARHYPVIEKLTPEAQDWINLIMVASAIYGAKLMARAVDAPLPHGTVSEPMTPAAQAIITPSPTPPSRDMPQPPLANGRLPEVRAAGNPLEAKGSEGDYLPPDSTEYVQ